MADPSLSKQWEAIERDCTSDLRTDPNAVRLYCARGAAEGAQFRIRLARRSFDRAVKLQPAQTDAWLALALLYRNLGARDPVHWPNAAEAAARALELRPGDPLAAKVREEALLHSQSKVATPATP